MMMMMTTTVFIHSQQKTRVIQIYIHMQLNELMQLVIKTF